MQQMSPAHNKADYTSHYSFAPRLQRPNRDMIHHCNNPRAGNLVDETTQLLLKSQHIKVLGGDGPTLPAQLLAIKPKLPVPFNPFV